MRQPNAVEALTNLLAALHHRVAGRSCGGCTACCEFPQIDELEKPAGIACRHCTGSGCAIHGAPERPGVCADFHCLWRTWEGMADAHRPDRCGVMVHFASDKDAIDYFARMRFIVTITDTPLSYYDPSFQEEIHRIVAQCRLPVFAIFRGSGSMIYPDPALADAILSPSTTSYGALLPEAETWRRRYEDMLGLWSGTP